MDDMIIKDKGKQIAKIGVKYHSRPSTRVIDYVKGQIEGLTKAESARRAGYSPLTAEKSNVIDMTDNYKIVLAQTLNITHNIMLKVNSKIYDMVKSEQEMTPTQWEIAKNASILSKNMVQIAQALSPKITLKEETRADGTVKRTRWGEMGATLKDIQTQAPDLALE